LEGEDPHHNHVEELFLNEEKPTTDMDLKEN
jgi:hypothetical protein